MGDSGNSVKRKERGGSEGGGEKRIAPEWAGEG